jgi:hypothetical protein
MSGMASHDIGRVVKIGSITEFLPNDPERRRGTPVGPARPPSLSVVRLNWTGGTFAAVHLAFNDPPNPTQATLSSTAAPRTNGWDAVDFRVAHTHDDVRDAVVARSTLGG